jgi:hypothetical protein
MDNKFEYRLKHRICLNPQIREKVDHKVLVKVEDCLDVIDWNHRVWYFNRSFIEEYEIEIKNKKE